MNQAIFRTFSDIERIAKRRKGILSNSLPITIDELKPVDCGGVGSNIRYKLEDLINIIDWKLCADQRKYASAFENFEKMSMYRKTSGVGFFTETNDDFWIIQFELFNREIRNGQNNTLYIGLDPKIIEKKLSRKMTKFEWKIQELYNDTFKHLTHNKKQDRIKVYVSW